MCCGGNASDLCSAGLRLEFRLRHHLPYPGRGLFMLILGAGGRCLFCRGSEHEQKYLS